MLRSVISLAAVLVIGGSLGAHASASCSAQAGEKKLAGAALTSFMKKCQTDAATVCSKTASDKKLAGAAKASFEKKCIQDAVGKK